MEFKTEFDSWVEAEDYINSLPNYTSNNMSMEDCSKFIIQSTTVRNILYDYEEYEWAFDLECEMRDVSEGLANICLIKCKKGE